MINWREMEELEPSEQFRKTYKIKNCKDRFDLFMHASEAYGREDPQVDATICERTEAARSYVEDCGCASGSGMEGLRKTKAKKKAKRSAAKRKTSRSTIKRKKAKR